MNKEHISVMDYHYKEKSQKRIDILQRAISIYLSHKTISASMLQDILQNKWMPKLDLEHWDMYISLQPDKISFQIRNRIFKDLEFCFEFPMDSSYLLIDQPFSLFLHFSMKRNDYLPFFCDSLPL